MAGMVLYDKQESGPSTSLDQPEQNGCYCQLKVLSVGLPPTKALLLGVHIQDPDSYKFPPHSLPAPSKVVPVWFGVVFGLGCLVWDTTRNGS